ncbi:hypothetical protein QOZ80_7BG0587880 [Eleusine coracana subsp. coracana]|nr:hypothetical protein QOZ80_7BG0587880 [Eleusine coracana subsp. coracana]
MEVAGSGAAASLPAASSSGFAMTTAAFPSWIMLERFVFRRDNEESFPNAPISVRGVTSWDAPFFVAFCLADPRHVSRIYARLPGFPDPRKQVPLAILAAHRHVVLLRVATKTSEGAILQDFFIYDATEGSSAFSLKALPACMEPDLDFHTRRDGRRIRRRRAPPQAEKEAPAKRRVMAIGSMGILCRDKQEFAVAELNLFKPSRTQIFADICMLRSGTSSSGNPCGEWNSMRVPIRLNGDNPAHEDMWLLCCWQTDTVVPFNRYLCWIDYYRGILFCDVFAEPTPTVYFHRFPLKEFPSTPNRSKTSSWLYRGATAIDDTVLMFVDVERNDGIGYGKLKPSAGFTISCYSLRLNVNIDRPHVVNFVISEFKYVMKKMWVVAIDLNTRTVESFYQYINGFEDRETEDADLTIEKSDFPKPFLPCEFSKFLRFLKEEEE